MGFRGFWWVSGSFWGVRVSTRFSLLGWVWWVSVVFLVGFWWWFRGFFWRVSAGFWGFSGRFGWVPVFCWFPFWWGGFFLAVSTGFLGFVGVFRWGFGVFLGGVLGAGLLVGSGVRFGGVLLGFGVFVGVVVGFWWVLGGFFGAFS